MITVSKETREKITKAADIVEGFSKLTEDFSCEISDNQNSDTPDFTSELLKERAKAIRDGEFKIVVCGKFKNGKSTFVNALLEKQTMAAKATACTAVIAIVSKGTDENSVKVVLNDGTSKKMSLAAYTDEYQLTEEEQQKIDAAADNGEDIVFDRFADIDHVEMQSMHPMFESGCSLIDTPGLEEALSRDKTTKEYLPKADAVIFMLNAVSLFSKAEKEFINKNFAGKNKNNVFFVVNRVNQLQPGQLEKNIIPSVKTGLRSCFTDESGRFDEDLFNRRVFYVNAYGALCAVTGQEEEAFVGGRWVSFPVDINATGMPEFEENQMAFIDSDERNNAVFASALDMIANCMKNTVAEKTAKLNAMAMNDAQRAEAAKKANEALEKAEETIREIEDAFEKFGKMASNALFLDLMNYFDKSIKGEFPAHVQNTITAQHYKASWQIADGLMNAMAILPINAIRSKAENLSQKHLQPISDDLDTYIKNKMLTWKTQSSACIKPYADDLNAEISSLCDEFDAHVSASFAAFEIKGSPTNRSTKGNIQTAIAIFIGKDMDAVVDINNHGGSVSWGYLAGKFLGQTMIDSILVAFAPEAVLLKFGIDALIVAIKAKKNAQAKALMMGEAAIDNYKEELKKNELSFKKSIVDNIEETKGLISATALQNLESEKNTVAKLAKTQKKSKEDEDALIGRLDSITQSMREKIDELYKLIYGRVPTDAEFTKLGANS